MPTEQINTLRNASEILEDLSDEEYDRLLDEGARPADTVGMLEEIIKAHKGGGGFWVKNMYGIGEPTEYGCPVVAMEEAGRREGVGWVVVDGTGAHWAMCGDSAVRVQQ